MVAQLIYCLKCNTPVMEFFTTFFKDDKGKRRYGAICSNCKDQELMDEASQEAMRKFQT